MAATDGAHAGEHAGTHVEGAAPPFSVADAERADGFDDPDDADDVATPAQGAVAARISAVLACAAGLGWTAWFGWTQGAALAEGDPVRIAAAVSDWAAPVLLVAVAWLVAMRSSTREAARFGDAARALSAESARLEERLLVINRELSLAREFVAAQSRDLESVGRLAVDRLSQHADRLATLVTDNGTRIDALGTVSGTALENMEKLRSQLPVVTSAAKDLANNIGNAGRTAQVHLSDLVGGFNRLNDFGQASERQVVALRARLADTLAELDTRAAELDHAAELRGVRLAAQAETLRADFAAEHERFHARLAERAQALADELATTRDTLDQAEAEALASLRARLSSLRDEGGAIGRALRDGEAKALAAWQAVQAALAEDVARAGERLGQSGAEADAELERRRAAFEDAHKATLDRIAAASAALDGDLAGRHAGQMAQMGELTARSDGLRTQLRGVEEQIAAVAAAGRAAREDLSARLDALGARVRESGGELERTEARIDGLTDRAVRLLELVQAGARHADTDLAEAIAQGDTRLSALSAQAEALAGTVRSAEAAGGRLADHVGTAAAGLDASGRELAALHGTFEDRTRDHAAALDRLATALAALDDAAQKTATRAQGELAEAIAALGNEAQDAVRAIETGSAAAIHKVAEQLGATSAAELERAMRLALAEISGQLEQASAHAAGVSREAALQMRNQLAKIDELVGNLERRVDQARTRAEEQVDNDFARRAAVITESLNSNAIDIARALDAEVGDLAWASYLRGDRGIFTRRAVRLLDNGEARSLAQLYEGDRDFHEHVSRYIHDFEGMLRQLLSTRDGHALGVTLLSSDMGKLYVALAQAIERLRS